MQKTQVGKKILLGMFLITYPVSASLAQPKPLTPMPAQAASSAVSNPAGAVTTSAPLLSSPFLSPAALARLRQDQLATVQAYDLVKIGDDFAQRGDWQNAQNQYQQALALSPNFGLGHQLALYGLIAYCRATGDTTRGLNYSRQAIYHHGSAAEGLSENDTAKLMQFALLLNKTGQSAEAISVYNHAAYALNYRDSRYNGGKPYLEVLLPELSAGPTLPEQVQYTPERLQALADTVLSHEERGFGSDKEAMVHMQEAVKLYPDSAVTYYYLGEAFPKRTPEQKAAYEKAAELGDDATVAAAKERLTPFR